MTSERSGQRRQSFYLDTHAYSLLAQPRHQSLRRNILRLRQNDLIEIVGATAVIEELAGISRTDEKHFRSVLRIFWRLVGNRVLRDRPQLIEGELTNSGRLQRARYFLPPAIVARLKAFQMWDLRDWKDLADDVYDQSDRVCQQLEAETPDTTDRQLRKNAARLELDDELCRLGVDEILHEIGRSREGTNQPVVARLPCTSAYCLIFGALLKKHWTSYGRRLRRSDRFDLDHYANAAVSACLVTNDRALTDTAKLIHATPVEIISTDEFARRVGALLDRLN